MTYMYLSPILDLSIEILYCDKEESYILGLLTGRCVAIC